MGLSASMYQQLRSYELEEIVIHELPQKVNLKIYVPVNKREEVFEKFRNFLPEAVLEDFQWKMNRRYTPLYFCVWCTYESVPFDAKMKFTTKIDTTQIREIPVECIPYIDFRNFTSEQFNCLNEIQVSHMEFDSIKRLKESVIMGMPDAHFEKMGMSDISTRYRKFPIDAQEPTSISAIYEYYSKKRNAGISSIGVQTDITFLNDNDVPPEKKEI